MGQVYLAEHVKMGRKSAIKVMSPSMVHDPDAVARFNREAANASRISHPNVCAVYDFGETPEGVIYLAMEFIEGEPLTELLAREGELPVARATAQDTMVQRLTDEPATLAEVRPELRFPPGLQATLDTALARNPADRYQSTTKFANDVAGVLGLQRGARLSPVPPTRRDSELDPKTELLRRSAAMPSARRPTPRRNRRLVPILAGTVVILGGVGTALALRGGGRAVGTAVRADTTPQVAVVPALDTTGALAPAPGST